MCALLETLSMRKARMASLILRAIDVSLFKRKVFATCWVIVEPPTGRRSPPRCTTFSIAARDIASQSTPEWA